MLKPSDPLRPSRDSTIDIQAFRVALRHVAERSTANHSGTATMATDGIQQLERLLREVVKLLEEPNPSNKRVAVNKLERVSSLAATLAATVRAQR